MLGPRQKWLRERTASVHADLERAAEAAGYFKSLPAYGRYIQRMHLLHRNLVAVFAGREGTIIPGLSLNERLAWLAKDLRSLGLEPLPAHAPRNMAAASLEDRASLLGYLYVILGATLGSRLLVREAAGLGLGDGHGASYLSSMSRSSDWGRFLDCLENEAAAAPEHLGAGAMAAFAVFHSALAEPEPA